jgi:hypothetical protein
MRVILNGRKVGNGDRACYFENKTYFTKRVVETKSTSRVVSSLAYSKGRVKPNQIEEKEANEYARNLLRNQRF